MRTAKLAFGKAIKEVFATLALPFFSNNTKLCTPRKYGGLERGYYLKVSIS